MKKVPLLLLAVLLLASCTDLPTLRPSALPTATPTPTAIATATPAPPTATPSPTPTAAPTPTAEPTASPSPTPTAPPAPAPTAKPTATASPAPTGKPAAVSLKLPPVLYGVVGREMALYLDSVVLSAGPYGCNTAGVGEITGKRWSWTPEKEGEYRLSVRAGNQNGTVLIKVAPAVAGKGRTRKCLFIGDSITEKGLYTAKLLELAKADGLKLTLLGSRGKAPNLTEGRAGWRAVYYTGRRSLSGVPNRFFNPSTKKFDFGYYMKKMKYASVDRVCIGLGTNDVFAYKDDKELKAEINRVLRRIDTMVKSVRTYSKKTSIGVLLTIPPTNSQRYFVASYGNKQTLARYQRNRFLFVNALIEKFKGQEKNGIYLVPVNAGFDAQYCYGVHPYGQGYDQIAETVWCWMKNLE